MILRSKEVLPQVWLLDEPQLQPARSHSLVRGPESQDEAREAVSRFPSPQKLGGGGRQQQTEDQTHHEQDK